MHFIFCFKFVFSMVSFRIADHIGILSAEKVWLELPLGRLVTFYSSAVRHSKPVQDRGRVYV